MKASNMDVSCRYQNCDDAPKGEKNCDMVKQLGLLCRLACIEAEVEVESVMHNQKSACFDILLKGDAESFLSSLQTVTSLLQPVGDYSIVVERRDTETIGAFRFQHGELLICVASLNSDK